MSASSEVIRARAALAAVEQAWESRRWAASILPDCESALEALPADNIDERAALQVWIGRLLVLASDPAAVARGVRSLEAGIAGLRDERALALAWMNHGSGLFRLGSPADLTKAVDSYARAVALLEKKTDAASINSRGAADMNRGAGLLHLAEIEPDKARAKVLRDESLASLQAAVAALSSLPTDDLAGRRNLASVWANLGQLRSCRGEPAEAFAAHLKSVEVSRGLAAGGDWPEVFGLAARLLNTAHAAGEANAKDASLAAGREALALAERLKTADASALDLALSARHALCVSLVRSPSTPEALSEAADLAEEGLTVLAKTDGTDARARSTGLRLFEFGAWLYRSRQPWFLAEFLAEHMGADEGRRRIAETAVRQARQDMIQRGFEGENGPGNFERSGEVLRSLAAFEETLRGRGVGG